MATALKNPQLSISKPDGHSRFVLLVDGKKVAKYEFIHQAGYPNMQDVIDQRGWDALVAWEKAQPASEVNVPGAGMQMMDFDLNTEVHHLYNLKEFGHR